MVKPLKKIKYELYYFVNGEEIDGRNPNMLGNCTGLTGNLDLIPIQDRVNNPEISFWTKG